MTGQSETSKRVENIYTHKKKLVENFYDSKIS